MLDKMPDPSDEEIDSYISYIKSRNQNFFSIVEDKYGKAKFSRPLSRLIVEFKDEINRKSDKKNVFFALAGLLHCWKLLERSYELGLMKENMSTTEKSSLLTYINYLEGQVRELKRQNTDLREVSSLQDDGGGSDSSNVDRRPENDADI